MVAEAYPGTLQSRRPPSLRKRVGRDLRKLYAYRHLIQYLVSASLSTENVGTYFGFVWWLLDPIIMAALYVLLIDVFLGRGIPHMPIYVMIALLSFEFTAKSVRNAMAQTLMKERAMRQLAFPRSVIPIAATIGESFHFLIAMILLVPIGAALGVEPTAWSLLIFPIAAVQFVMTLALAFFFSAANMFFRDVDHLSTYLFRLWFYLSPCFYLVSVVPEQYQKLYSLNPFVTFFGSYRAVIMYASAPAWKHLAALLVGSILLLIATYSHFVGVASKFARVE